MEKRSFVEFQFVYERLSCDTTVRVNIVHAIEPFTEQKN